MKARNDAKEMLSEQFIVLLVTSYVMLLLVMCCSKRLPVTHTTCRSCTGTAGGSRYILLQ
jgi:hypothetical protein